MPPKPVGLDLATFPTADCLMRPPILTWCLCETDFGRLDSALALFLQVGWAVVGDGFGDSGRFNAFSSQLDLVGLQRLGSMVFDGLDGMPASSSFSSPRPVSIDIRLDDLEISPRSDGLSPCCEVGLLEVGVAESLRTVP